MEAAEALDRARRSDPGLLGRTVHWTASREVPNSPITAGHGTTGMTVVQLIGPAAHSPAPAYVLPGRRCSPSTGAKRSPMRR